MTTAILVGGLIVTLLVAIAMRRPEWRVPALIFAILAIPGNVDNLMPQMRLDPNALANNTGPVVSFVDVLIVWALVLAFREGRLRRMRPPVAWIVVGAVGFAALAAAATVINVAQGADVAAAVRGVIVLGRIPALLALTVAHRGLLGQGRLVAGGVTLGLIALLGNGLYTSNDLETVRFTAATVGRNGFALALVVAALIAAGLAVELWRDAEPRPRLLAAVVFALAAAALFGAIATGTRMALLAAVPAIVIGLLVNRSWWSWRGAVGVAAILAGAVLVSAGAVMWTAEGGRAISVVTDPGDTVDIITDPGSEPDYSPVRTRTRWWDQAFQMIREDPLTGVGAYQWNFRRYGMDAQAIEVVADPHNTYIELAAEYGVPVLATYLALLVTVVLAALATVWRRAAPTSLSAVSTALAAAALMIPITELTNSHLFNVRLGAMTWLLLGVALSLTLVPVVVSRQHGPVTHAETRASARDRSVGSGATPGG